ncbi:MAG: hypothetical protein IT483_13115 [Gammaproteobacteria bacterium]|nr:hypothetical protein [Gammaproteobacteria bacterium]
MKKIIVLFSMLSATTLASPAIAGIYTDDLSRCFVEKTTKDDRARLVRWLFTAAASNPALAGIYAKITPEQMEAANKDAGGLLMQLLTNTCVEQARKAAQYEPQWLPASMQVLFGVAGAEMFAGPEVTQSVAGIGKYLDEKKLQELVPK